MLAQLVLSRLSLLQNLYTLTSHFIRYSCSLVTQIADQSITWQQLNAFRRLDVVKTTQTEHQNGEERDLSDSERGMVVGARRISETVDLLGFPHTTISSVYREWSEKEKISSEGGCVDEHALLMSEVRGEWTDWLESPQAPPVCSIHMMNQSVNKYKYKMNVNLKNWRKKM